MLNFIYGIIVGVIFSASFVGLYHWFINLAVTK